MNILITHCHSDCTYSLLKVLELIPNIQIYIPTKEYVGLTTFLLNYNEWPINQFKDIIHPLEELKSLDQVDFFFAEIINVQFLEDGTFTDSQVEWGIKNLGIEKLIAYSYNVIGCHQFKYRNEIPLISSAKVSFDTYGSAPKHFFYAETPILPFSFPKTRNTLILAQNSYEVQVKTRPEFEALCKSPFFKDYCVKYYGYTEDEELKKLNTRQGERIPRDEMNRIIKNEMTFALHLKDHEGYGYHPIKCLFAGRPVINFRKNVKGMTYEDYLIDGKTALLIDSIEELKDKLEFFTKNRFRLNKLAANTALYARNFFNFKKENQKAAEFFTKEIFEL